MKSKKKPEKLLWENKFIQKIQPFHKRSYKAKAVKIVKRAETTKNSLVARSKKMGVKCTITTDDLYKLMYESYGCKCKYCHKILTIDNMVFDHTIPISKGGDSTPENMQVICRTSNSMKGSLTEENFLMLLNWLDTAPEELKKDVSIRLARGIH